MWLSNHLCFQLTITHATKTILSSCQTISFGCLRIFFNNILIVFPESCQYLLFIIIYSVFSNFGIIYHHTFLKALKPKLWNRHIKTLHICHCKIGHFFICKNKQVPLSLIKWNSVIIWLGGSFLNCWVVRSRSNAEDCGQRQSRPVKSETLASSLGLVTGHLALLGVLGFWQD